MIKKVFHMKNMDFRSSTKVIKTCHGETFFIVGCTAETFLKV